MKILAIHFQNINNLKGEHSLRFDSPPLSEAGIFAITGPTGSGKSTLLDVITLALYKRTPRFKAISKKDIADLGSIITHHTDSSYAKVEYEANGKRYSSSWSISKARTGNLREYEMALYDAEGRPLDLKRSEVPAKNEAIIGLSYEQFVQSILLSQGDFSRFLKADKHKRGQLLEQITGTYIYRDIGKKAFEKFRELKQELADAQKQIEVITVLDEDSLAALTTLVDDQSKKQDIQNKQLEQVRKKITDIQAGQALYKEQDANQTAWATLLSEKKAFASDLLRLEQYTKILPFQSTLDNYKKNEQQQQLLQIQLEQDRKLVQQAQQTQAESMASMSSLVGADITESNFREKMSNFERTIIDLDNELKEIKKEGARLREEAGELLLSSSMDIQLDRQPERALDQLHTLSTEIKTNYDFIEEDKETLRLKRTQLQDIENEWRSYLDILGIKSKLNEKLGLITARIQPNKQEYARLQNEKKTVDTLINTLDENVILLDQHKSDTVKIASLEAHRADLENGKPCPLCGSLDHPYSEHGIDVDEIKAIEEKLNKAKKDLQQERDRLQKITIAIATLDTSIVNDEKQCTDLQADILSQDTVLKSLKNIELSDRAAAEKSWETSKQKLKDLDAALIKKDTLATIDRLVALYTKLQQTMTTYVSVNKKRQALYTGEAISKVCNDLQDSFAKANQQIELCQQKLQQNNTLLESLNKEQNNNNETLQKAFKDLGIQDSFESIAALLLSHDEAQAIKEKQENFLKKEAALEQQKEALLTKITAFETQYKDHEELASLQTTLDILEKELTVLNQQLGAHKEQISRDKKDRERIASIEKSLGHKKEEFETWSMMKDMIGDATGNTFSNFAQSLTLRNLIVYANQRLQSLSDRYLIDSDTTGDTIMIRDLYQGNITRAVSTLSGGEIFILSLALALSLSDMASRNVRLDSLFIDEGFGTLDPETLDIAVSTLEKLQDESQKTVGVISHVSALKERIYTQVQLEKDAQGYSQIKVVN